MSETKTPSKPMQGPSAIWVNVPETGALPNGVSHRTFHSNAHNTEVGYCIYLPPGYDKQEQKYPVIYNLHGAGDNELHGFHEARVLDEGIRAGKWPPMIMVLPNGGMRTFYKDSYDGKFMSETLIIRELIPHIDATYNTIAEQKGRCIEGHSMGGRGATRLAMKFPTLFCSLFNLAGNVPRTSGDFDSTKPEVYPNNYLGSDKQTYIDNDAFELLKKNQANIKDKLRIQIWCGTQDKSHLMTVRDFHQALLSAEVDHTYMEVEGQGHGRIPIIELYRDIWFDYHVESMKRAGAWS